MRTTYDPSVEGVKNTVDFVDDIPGGYLVECPSGFQISTEYTRGLDDPFYDPWTGKEVFYPGWAEW